jgi:hypothetical protein
MQNVVFKFRRPRGAEQQTPSLELTEALRHLSETAEMRPLIAEARKSGGAVAIEVFQTRNGRPILIHFTKENAA